MIKVCVLDSQFDKDYMKRVCDHYGIELVLDHDADFFLDDSDFRDCDEFEECILDIAYMAGRQIKNGT